MDLEKGIAKIQLKVTTDLRESMGDEAATFIEKTQDADFINSMEKLVKKDFEIDKKKNQARNQFKNSNEGYQESNHKIYTLIVYK